MTSNNARCAACHGANGEGGAGAGGMAYAPLAGNRKVTLRSSANLLHVILNGGFPPTTAGNPRPYGMPPFGASLKDAEIAAMYAPAPLEPASTEADLAGLPEPVPHEGEPPQPAEGRT